MKKLILLVGIFVSSISFGQLTGTQKEINKKAEIVAERVYNLLTQDLLANRGEFEKYLTTPNNEYNTKKTGVQIKVSLGNYISDKVLDGNYNDYVEVINSPKFIPVQDHITNYELKYIDGKGGYYLIFEITDESDQSEHSIIVGFFDDLSIKSILVMGYTDEYPLVYHDKDILLYTSL